MRLHFDHAEFDGQLQRTATAAYSGSADLAEMLVAAAKLEVVFKGEVCPAEHPPIVDRDLS
jgi:hypothetical protein